ncbi:hypothetical protein RHGRI_037200 [Rhododendron griersonianum]|uniref:Uncharacterized protein n=1 Tax=Rhododendron griersonianum TaxID=479676 RepID=A0AAV6HUW3_9ERIC|nr:hypothetical protein RHGRI_037200 [Rhododendron griersonianum]
MFSSLVKGVKLGGKLLLLFDMTARSQPRWLYPKLMVYGLKIGSFSSRPLHLTKKERSF